jgi:glucose/arabinose dehydrogenase
VLPESGSSASVAGTEDARGLRPLGDVDVRFRRVVSGLDRPVGVAGAKDGTRRIFVVQQDGRVRVVRGGRLQRGSYLDLRGKVAGGGEQGLLGIAFPNDFRRASFVYVSYVRPNGALQVSRFRAAGPKASRVRPGSERRVIRVPHPGFTNHNGGGLAFDGRLLLVSTGDGGGTGDPNANAGRRTSLLGKILRLDVSRSCGPRAYCVPRDNPYAGATPGRGEVWASGLRNPWRFSVDRATGDVWIGDVGQNRFEEIDRIPDGRGGLDFGWSCREGRSTFRADRCVEGRRYTAPVHVYGRARGGSVIGGHVYRGSAERRALRGRYVFGDFVSGAVWARSPGGAVRRVGTLPRLTAFGESSARELFAVTIDGTLWRLRTR